MNGNALIISATQPSSQSAVPERPDAPSAPPVKGKAANRMQPLKGILLLTALYMVAEAVGGYTSGSLALLADAGHMLTDVAALSFAVFSGWLASRPSTEAYPFGFGRAEILAATVNGLLLLGLCIAIMIEAISRFAHPQPIASDLMFWIALGGALVNGYSAWRLHQNPATHADHHTDPEHEDLDTNLNLRAAYLHILGDLLGSVGAVVAAIVMRTLGWLWADPAISLLISALILISALRLLKQSVHILMEGTPEGVDRAHVAQHLLSVPGVLAVSHLRVWAITSGDFAMSANIIIAENADWFGVIDQANLTLKHHQSFGSITLQPSRLIRPTP